MFPIQSNKWRSIYVGGPNLIRSALASLGSENAIINERHPTYSSNPDGIALGIWMEAQEKIEQRQVWTSSFAHEDLVSNLVGYGISRSLTNQELGAIGTDAEDKWNVTWLERECELTDEIYSLKMFDAYESHNGFSKNRNWTPPSMPFGNNVLNNVNQTAAAAGSTTSSCTSIDVDQQFMSTFTYSLLSTAVMSSSSQGGAWWWDTYLATRQSAARIPADPNNSQPFIRNHLFYAFPIPEGVLKFGGGC